MSVPSDALAKYPQELRERFGSAPIDCANATDPGVPASSSYRDWSSRPTTEDQWRMEEFVAGFDLRDSRILHIGIGNSGFARRFHSRARHITGLTVDKAELRKGTSFGFPNYTCLLRNKYSAEAFEGLGPFDFVLENNPSSMVCCLRHLEGLITELAQMLSPSGMIVSDLAGLADLEVDPPTHPSFSLDLASITSLAELPGLRTRIWRESVVVLERASNPGGSIGDDRLRLKRQLRDQPLRWGETLSKNSRQVVRRLLGSVASRLRP